MHRVISTLGRDVNQNHDAKEYGKSKLGIKNRRTRGRIEYSLEHKLAQESLDLSSVISKQTGDEEQHLNLTGFGFMHFRIQIIINIRTFRIPPKSSKTVCYSIRPLPLFASPHQSCPSSRDLRTRSESSSLNRSLSRSLSRSLRLSAPPIYHYFDRSCPRETSRDVPKLTERNRVILF